MRSKFGRRLIVGACIDTTGVYDKVRISNVSLGIRATLSFDTFQSGTLSRVLDRSKVPAFKHFRRMLSLFLNQVYSTDANSALTVLPSGTLLTKKLPHFCCQTLEIFEQTLHLHEDRDVVDYG